MFVEAGLDRLVGLPACAPGRRHVWNQYVVRVPQGQRDPLRGFLAEANVGTEIYYPMGLHEQECFKQLGYKRGDMPNSEKAADQTLALPIYPELTDEQIVYVAGKVKEFLG